MFKEEGYIETKERHKERQNVATIGKDKTSQGIKKNNATRNGGLT